jgi:IPT/TIG domain/PASTA domain
MRRRLVCAVVAVGCAILASSAKAATVTIGQLFAPGASCGAVTFLQQAVASGASYTVPAAGVITSWSFQTDAATTPDLKFKIGRTAGGGNYTITAEAAAGTQTASAVNTYPASIPVQAGDLIGVYGAGGNCGNNTNSPSDIATLTRGDVPPGTTAPFMSAAGGEIDISAQEILQPGVASVSPAQGPVSGGTVATITGHDFTGATGVSFGGTPAGSFTVNSDTSLTAITPTGLAGAVDVTVTTPGGESATSPSDQFTYAAPPPPPVVTSIFPPQGPRTGGTQVTITGHGFTGATAVSFGSHAATGFGLISDTVITAITPAAAAGRVDVTVAGPNGQSVTTVADRFTFAPVCVVPNLEGKSFTSAKKLLKRAHCTLGTVTGTRTGKVKRQSRKPGTTLPQAAKVNVVLPRQRGRTPHRAARSSRLAIRRPRRPPRGGRSHWPGTPSRSGRCDHPVTSATLRAYAMAHA